MLKTILEALIKSEGMNAVLSVIEKIARNNAERFIIEGKKQLHDDWEKLAIELDDIRTHF